MRDATVDLGSRVAGREWIVAVAIVAVMVALPPIVGPWITSIVTQIIILSIFGIAFNLAFGFADLGSFGHAAFYGLGGYGTGLALVHLTPESLLIPALIGIVAAIIYGGLVAFFATKGHGIYFAVITFAFAQLIYEVVYRWTEFTGGSEGQYLSLPSMFGLELWNPSVIYYIALLTLVLFMIVGYRLINSPFGNVMRAIRYNEERTEAIGYPVRRVKIVVFMISAGFSGIAGVLHVFQNSFVSPSMLYFTTSVDVLIVAIIGGFAYFTGPIAGAIVLVTTQEVLREYTSLGLIVTGFIFLAIIIFFNKGIVGFLRERVIG